ISMVLNTLKKWMILKNDNHLKHNNMKKTALILTATLIWSLANGQTKCIREFQEKYRDFGTYFSLRIDGGLLQGLSKLETNNEEAGEFVKIIQEIEAIDIHAIGREEAGFSASEVQKFKKQVKKDNYEELMMVKDADGDVDFMIKESRGRVSDLLLMVDGKEEFLVLNINGDIDLKHISKIGKQLNMKGMEHLDKIDEE
ncbi:DUF4252 domain-containing protein, partial [Bacteroidota bacterium]